MHALKIEKNGAKAIELFREALALDPTHEDTRYYLATALAAEGNTDAALAEYAELTRVNSRSHRGIAEWGKLRAMTFRNTGDLAAAEEALAKAHELNPEETGTLIVLAEVALMRGDDRLAQRRLESVCQTNPRAAGALFVLGYLQWKEQHPDRASQFLDRARQALGPDWKPAGTTAEGDVRVAARPESTPLSRFWHQWDGPTAAPARVYARLDTYLRAIRR